jgi:hypothetical protein
MKKIILPFLLLCSIIADAQIYGKTVVLGTGRPSFKVGTLPLSGPNAFEKLKVEVLGGGWYSSNVGEATFYIAVRDGLVVNEEIHGGGVSHFDLKIYQVSNGYDVAIAVNEDWPSFTIRSWMNDGSAGLHELAVTQYTPTGTDVTPVVNILHATLNDGKTGIGMMPDAKLSVKGDIHAKEVKVDVAFPPDYVFAGDYHLPTLAQVEAYIKQNRHLPEVPSAKEMEADGVKVGEMNMLLLKKVEELTLYVIELEKKVNKLEKK